MSRISVDVAGSKNMLAFLDVIAYSEIGPVMLAMPETDQGYRVCVGSYPSRNGRPAHLIIMLDYVRHPGLYDKASNSDAAGRYQVMSHNWLPYKRMLALPDFGPESQDRIALQLIHECHATNLVHSGDFGKAVTACNSRWASLPGAGYHQHENKMPELRAAYTDAGGTVA